MCAAKGYDLVLTMPQGMSREREGLLRLYGARVEITESLGGMDEAVEAARAIATRDDVFLPDQFSNPANPEIHRHTTGRDLGRARRPRRRVRGRGRHRRHDHRRRGGAQGRNPDCRIVAVEPSVGGAVGRPARPSQDPGDRSGFIPAVLNREVIDEVIAVDDEAARHRRFYWVPVAWATGV